MTDYTIAQPVSDRSPRRPWLLGGCAMLAAAIVVGYGVHTRNAHEAALTDWTEAQAIPSVNIVTPGRGLPAHELVLPSDIEAYYEAPIHARISGYVKMWYRDIGAHVKAGELLAEIDTPDLDQQYSQAKANLATAKANQALADLTAKRWSSMLVSNAVSKQAIDEKVGDALARKAETEAALANVQRLDALESFKRITAPFDGVVTARKTDIGALIAAGGSTLGPELFSVADMHRMRIYVRVPQTMSAALTPGMTAELKLPQYPGRLFTAKLETTSNAVSKDSRTVLAEFMADNKDGALWLGAYAEAHLQLKGDDNALTLPSSVLLFRKHGLQVATVDAKNHVTLHKVTLKRDLGAVVEIDSGVQPNERVIDNPPDSIENGDAVQIETPKEAGAAR